MLTARVNLDPPEPFVTGIPRCRVVKRSIIMSALKTHEKLNDEDRRFGVTVIDKLNLSDEDLASAVLHMYKLTNTGRFCLTFNLDLDMHLKSKNKNRVEALAKASKELAFPELYENESLTLQERQVLERMYNKEYYAVLNTIETAKTTREAAIILPCDHEHDEILFHDSNHYLSIYNKCYKDICIYESWENGEEAFAPSGQSSIPCKVYVSDRDKAYCFDMIELVKKLGRGNLINPNTGIEFSNAAQCQLINKYMKEIKMYRKYLCILKEHGF